MEGRLSSVWETGSENALKALRKGRRVQEGLDSVQEGNPKGTGADPPCVLKSELVGIKMSLAEWGALTGTQDKKESL